MAIPQRPEYRLQDKLNELSSDEFAELQRYSNMEIMSHASEYYDYFAGKRQEVHEKYNKKRKRAIWWYQHQFDVVAIVIIAIAVLVFLYFLLA